MLWVVLLFVRITELVPAAEKGTFFRGINLNGPPVVIDGQQWEGKESTNYECRDKAFENQNVPLVPPIDAERAKMIRSSRWGGNSITLTNIPSGRYSVLLYVWEDNQPETFSVLINDREVLRSYNSGSAGHWERLGPWVVNVTDGTIRLTSRGGAANFSGIELWRGEHDGSAPWEQTSEGVEFFEKRIRPLFVKHCYECHSSTAKELGGELAVDSRQGLRRGGNSGPAIRPGEVERSLLIKAVRRTQEDLKMPPSAKLSDAEITDLENWVRMYAPDPRAEPASVATRAQANLDWVQARDFWSLKPVKLPTPPEVHNKNAVASELDRFVLAALERQNLDFSPEADRRALLRRVTFDLTGLPPTPEETANFLQDAEPDSFEKVVERLLASPRYGERWGRHWLDVVRYSDTAGDNSDFPVPQMYRYRNWVIDALNRDLPYDQMVREQLAGDLLGGDSVSERQERIVATGYIANARRFGSRVDDYPQHLTIEDTLDNLGRTFLATTINCARCHHHKFDPIMIEDYYALYGIFHSTRYPWPGIELEQKQRDLIPLVSPEDVTRAMSARQHERERLANELKMVEQAQRSASGEDRKEFDKRLAETKQKLNEFEKSALPFEQAYAVTDAARIEDVAIHRKGDPLNPGVVVRRRFLTLLGGATLRDDDVTSGRLELARWITDPANPLAARVIVNRIWLWHFGRGLVPTPNDFGRQGKPPSHPELLDWLADRFVKSGWSIKQLHRVILRSRTYRQASVMSEEARQRDPSNVWLSAFPRHRLDAEAIRDSLLKLGGNLDSSRGGAHPFPPQSSWKFTQHNPFKAIYDTNRRSVYLMTQRIQRHPYLAIFDGADPSASAPQRIHSTTPLQALYLLNDPFVHEQAKGFARQLLAEIPSDEDRVRSAYEFSLGRPPADEELQVSLLGLGSLQTALKNAGVAEHDVLEQSWEALCRAIFRLSEFVYID